MDTFDNNPKNANLNSFEAQQRLLVLTELYPNPIVEINQLGEVTYVNQAARMQFPDLYDNKSNHMVLEGITDFVKESLQENSSFVVFEREVKMADCIFEEQIFSIPKNNRAYMFLNDITKRKKMEREKLMADQQLSQAQKMEAIGQLAGGLAHDFNNILTVIKGNLQLLKADHQNENKDIKKINAALEATDRAANLSKHLLGFSRKDSYAPKVVDIKPFIEDIYKLLHPILGKNIIVKLEINDSSWKIFVDPYLLENVILNLAVNARDAMEGEGTFTIQAQNVVLSDDMISSNKLGVRPGEYLKISLKDTGSGIPEEILPLIFDPFYTTKDPNHGTGLGLSQVEGFITQSQGKITVETEINVGTTFNLFLPRISEPNSH